MVELIRAHRSNEAKIIDVAFKVGQPVETKCRFVRLDEGVLCAEKLRHAADECKALAGQKGGRTVLTIELDQLGLVLEQLQLAWSARHVQIDDTTGFG